MSRAVTVAVNAISSYGRFLVTLAVLFVLTPVIIDRAGEEDFALWSLTFSILGVLGLLDMGFLTGVVKWVAECKGTGDEQRRNHIISTVAIVYLALGAVALVVVLGMSFVYHEVFGIPPHLRDKALALLWILSARMVILSLPLSLFLGILYGEQRIVMINIVQTVAALAYGICGFQVLDRGYGVVGLAWVHLGVMLGEHALYIALAYVRVPNLRVSLRLWRRSLLREVVSFSFAAMLINLSALVRLRTDPILVKSFISLPAVAIYAIAMRIAENAYLLLKQFVNVLAPYNAQLAAEGRSDELKLVLVVVAKFAVCPAVMLSAAFFVFGTEAIGFWVGPELKSAGPVLNVLLLSLIVSVPPLIASTILTMTGDHEIPARAAIVSIVVNVSCSIGLVFPLGLKGIALGTLAATLIVDVLIVLRKACAIYKVRFLSYARRVYLTALIPGVAQWAVTYGISVYAPPTGLVTVVLASLPGVVVYAAIFWTAFVSPAEKQLIVDKLIRRRGRASR